MIDFDCFKPKNGYIAVECKDASGLEFIPVRVIKSSHSDYYRGDTIIVKSARVTTLPINSGSSVYIVNANDIVGEIVDDKTSR